MIRLAVDAINLRADERGMGRLVRGMLPVLAEHAVLTLLIRETDDAAVLAPQLPAVKTFAPIVSASIDGRYDAVWYPWNGVRFEAAAPALVMICDDFAWRFPARGPIARYREQAPIRRAVRDADAFVTISAWSREVLAARFKIAPERFDVLPLTPDATFVPAAETSPYDRPFVLFVGGSERRKNLGFFSAAFAAAFPDGNVRLVVANAVDDATLLRLYRTARAVAVPSLAEGFGLVLAEAQACGAAVIASNASALPEAAGDAALLVAPTDRAGWIAGLQTIVRDDARNAWLRTAGAARWTTVPRDGAALALRARLTRLVDERA